MINALAVDESILASWGSLLFSSLTNYIKAWQMRGKGRESEQSTVIRGEEGHYSHSWGPDLLQGDIKIAAAMPLAWPLPPSLAAQLLMLPHVLLLPRTLECLVRPLHNIVDPTFSGSLSV